MSQTIMVASPTRRSRFAASCGVSGAAAMCEMSRKRAHIRADYAGLVYMLQQYGDVTAMQVMPAAHVTATGVS